MLQHVVKAGMEELRVEVGMKDSFKEKLLKSRLKMAALWKEWGKLAKFSWPESG